MVYGLTESEQVVKQWLVTHKDFEESKITRSPKQTPDFKTEKEDYEAKKLYGNKLIFYETQMQNIEEDTIIVVTDLDKVISYFYWRERQKQDYDIKIVDNASQHKGNSTLSVPKKFALRLRKDFEGSNDMERLKDWADQFSQDKEVNDLDEERVREICKDVIEQEKRGY